MFKIFSLVVFFLILTGSLLLKNNLIDNQVSNALEIAESDKVWLAKFVDEFFFNDHMVFTLFGSKPMGGQVICTATEEESLASFEQALKDYTEDEKKHFIREYTSIIRNTIQTKTSQSGYSGRSSFHNLSSYFARELLKMVIICW